MVDPVTTPIQPVAPRAGSRVRTGVAAFVAATALIAGGAAWPAFFGSDAPARATVQAASPALVNGGPVATSYADLVQQVSPAVVAVRSSRLVQQTSFAPDSPLRRFFGQGDDESEGPHREGGLGSGVIVTPDGYILTNNHVVAGADHVTVDFTDGRSLTAKVVGTDPPSDLAVLKVAGSNFKTLPLADSEAVRVGDVVLAIGHPLNLGQTVTMGIISAKDRATRSGADPNATYEDFLQTDAPINKGNSGGALINLRGELVGINSQILSPTGGNIGIGFAIPSSMAHDVMTQLLEKGSVRRGLLGLVAQPVTADLARSLNLADVRGVIVASVSEDSAAERAGLQQGDVILALDGKRIDSSNNLRNSVARLAPGTKVTLDVLRDGAKRSITATLAERPTGEDEDAPKPTSLDKHTKAGSRYGLEIDPLTPEVARELKAKARTGVVVAGVDPAGVAAEAGFQAGDIITAVNHTKVTDADSLKAALDRTPSGRPALVLIDRRGQPGYFTLERPQG